MKDEVFYAATKILAASVTGSKGDGLHESPEIVARSVRLAKLLVIQFDDEAKADDDARVALVKENERLAAALKQERADHGNTCSTLADVREQLAAALPKPEKAPAPVVGDPAIVAAITGAAPAGAPEELT